MQAVVITRFGGPEVLKFTDLPEPVIGDEEVLIDNKAAAVNPIDAKIAEGSSFVCKKREGDPFPWSLGFDCAGVVVKAGCKSGFSIGDRVAGTAGSSFYPSAYAQIVALHKDSCIKIPDGIDFDKAAALITAGLTALSIIDEFPEDARRIFISGGSGGVGHLLLQYLKIQGFYVAASCSESHMMDIEDIADEVFDYKNSLPHELEASFDVAVDMPGGAHGIALYPLIKKGGLLITVPTITEDMVKAQCPEDKKCLGVRCIRSQENYQALFDYAKEGIVPRISVRMPLKNASLAHILIKGGHTAGKIVLIP